MVMQSFRDKGSRKSSAAKMWIKQELARSCWRAFPAIGAGVAQTALAIVQAFCAARLMTNVIHPGTIPLAPFILAFLSAGFMRGTLMLWQEQIATALGISARRRLRSNALTNLIGAGPGRLRGRRAAELTDVIVGEIESIGQLYSRWIPAIGLAMVSPTLIVVTAALIDPVSGIIFLITGALGLMLMSLAGMGAAATSRSQSIELARLRAHFADRIQGLSTIVLANAVEEECKTLAAALNDLRRRTARVLRVGFLSNAALDLAFATCIIGIAAHFSAKLFFDNTLAIVPRALFMFLLIPEFFAPFRAVHAVYLDRITVQKAAEKLNDLPRPIPSEPSPPPHSIRTVSTQGVSVAFENVSFAWDDRRGKILDQVSFHVPSGETMMLIGPSGSGKSTIIDLLLGHARPQSGRITINGAAIETLVPAALARLTALIDQRPFLFTATLADNIRLGHPEAGPEQVLDAAERAQVMAFARDLPDGLDTMVGEGGCPLSCSQAQRIAIARAFLKDAQLLLLDEPTAQLDQVAEHEVLESLRRLTIGRTAILVTQAVFGHEFTGRRLALGARPSAALQGVAC